MTIPAVMFVESAAAMLKSRDSRIIAAELKEFRAMGGSRMAQAKIAAGEVTDAELGYLLGLETARAFLAGNLAAVQAKVEF